MKNKLILIAALATLALPAMAETVDFTALDKMVYSLQESRDKQGDRIEALEKRAHGAAERDKAYQSRIEALEKKVTHITNILKLKQENSGSEPTYTKYTGK